MRTASPSSTSAGTTGGLGLGMLWVLSAQLLTVLVAGTKLFLPWGSTLLFRDKNQTVFTFHLFYPFLHRRGGSWADILLKSSSAADQRRGYSDVIQCFSRVDLEAWPRNVICSLYFPPFNQVLLLLAAQYFASIMVIVGLSVVVTVLVLQFHHHDPQAGKMPKWVSSSGGKQRKDNCLKVTVNLLQVRGRSCSPLIWRVS